MKAFSILAVLTAALVSMFAVVGSAQAANWGLSPTSSAFTAPGPGATLKVQGRTHSCVSTSANGTTAPVAGGVFTSQFNAAASVTLGFATCTNAGVNWTWSCKPASLNAGASGFNGGTTTIQAASAGLSTVGSLTGIACSIKPTAQPSDNCATFTGTVPATYTNAATLAAGTGPANHGTLAISNTGQSLNMTAVGGCISSIGTGSATLGALTYTVSGSPMASVAAPDIWAN